MATREQLITIQGISKYRYKKPPNLETGISYVDSIFKETNRLSDDYFFWINKDGLVDRYTNEYLHDLITPDSHEESYYLGLVEYSVLWQLDSWSLKKDIKLSVWISPELKREGLYDENKIVLHEISESPAGQKKLNNIMIIFECNRDECLKLAKQLFPNQTININNPEELRCALIDVGTTISIAEIMNVLSPYIPKEKRTARYVSVIAIYDSVSESVRTFEGSCEGLINTEPVGENGFGPPLGKKRIEGLAASNAEINCLEKGWLKIKSYLFLGEQGKSLCEQLKKQLIDKKIPEDKQKDYLVENLTCKK